MKFSIGLKLGGIIGILLCLFLVLGLMAYQGIQTIQQQVQQVADVEQPTSAAAYEMDVNLLRMVVGVLGYLQDRATIHLDQINQGREGFQQAQADYDRFVNSARGKALGAEGRKLYARFAELADTIVKRDDDQHQQFAQLLTNNAAWKTLLEEQMKAAITSDTDADAALSYAPLKIAAGLETSLDEIQRFLSDYLQTHDQTYQDQLTDERTEFEQKILNAYTRLPLSNQEKTWVTQLRQIVDQNVVLVDRIMTLEKQNNAALSQFIELRRNLGNTVIYDGIIRTAADHLNESKGKAMTAVRTVNRTILVVLLVGVGFGLVFGMLFSRSITQPLQQVVDAASNIAVGDLSVKLDRQSSDEIGRLANSFRGIIAYIHDVAKVTETIADGDLRVDVRPKSERDVLNGSLQKMIAYIQDVANVTERISNKDLQVLVEPKSAHDVLNQSLQRMIANLRVMIQEIEQNNWVQNGLNQLGNELLGEPSLLEVCHKALRFVAHYLKAGVGALYVYDPEHQTVKLYSSFAFTERNRVSNSYQLGEGIVGQVALEKAPVLLRHVRQEQGLIKTGTTSKTPLNTYTFPLLYNQELYGVLELASFDRFDEAKQAFLKETAPIMATGIFSTKQRERVQELLQVSQQAQQAAEQAAREAEQAKADAQRKADEVQQANARLEEQQQKLQQQSEELQQVNTHLQEQQHRLQQQSEELRQQNESLEKTRQELNKRARQLELASKYKSEFLANMSHELRTPLNSIILLSKMLSRNDKKNLDAKDVKQATVIHQAGEELLRLINDILDLSKIEAGKVTLNVMEFSTETLLDSFRDLFHSIAEEKKLTFNLQDDLHALLRTDKDKLSQVIRNLLANAFKFTKTGSVSLSVRPHPSQTDRIQILVADTGIGIPKDKQDIVFEAFQQADGSTSREYGGTGLGLSIAREYMKLLQGTMELESEVGQGSTFTLTLPVALKDVPVTEKMERPKERQPVSDKTQPVLQKPQSIPTAIETIEDDRNKIVSGDKVILIIEDNADLAQNMMDVTRGLGFKVLAALDGRTGLELAAKYRPTGILLDLVLPDLNGMEVLRELKSTRELRHIPVHIMSSKERDNSFRMAGAIGYFQKPVNDLDIQRAVENLLSVSAKLKQLLIVEDNETERDEIRKLIGDSQEITITSVPSQAAAIAEIEKKIYDAAIVDLGLKDRGGYTICQYIKEHRVLLPVILYTGRELTEEDQRELQQCTTSMIVKTARSHETLSDEAAVFLHKMYHGEQAQPAQAATPRTLQPTGSLEGKKILIVDDDLKNIFVLASALEHNGATIVDAQNGQIALDMLRQRHDIDLVLMDIMMPVMDGYTAIQQIRKDPKLKHLPVIALTAKALAGDRQKCIQAGADDYLSKPVDYDGLIRLAKAWIEKG